jgi:2-methylcitrate dehydratase PrpD
VLAGSVAESGTIVRRYLSDFSGAGGASTLIGTDIRLAPRFATFGNGLAIHADDYDDMQLAVAPDRVYDLLTHPMIHNSDANDISGWHRGRN